MTEQLSNEIYVKDKIDILSIRGDTRVERDGKFIKVAKKHNTFYKRLKKKYPNLKKYTSSQIRKHIIDFNVALYQEALAYRDGVMLPAHLGGLFIVTYGKRTKAIDHKASKAAKKDVYFSNEWSCGYGGWPIWVPQAMKYKFKNSNLWTLRPGRPFRIALMEAYKTDWKRYMVVPGLKFIVNFIKITLHASPDQIKNTIVKTRTTMRPKKRTKKKENE